MSAKSRRWFFCLSSTFLLLLSISWGYNQSLHKQDYLKEVSGAACGPCIWIPLTDCGYDGGTGTCVWDGTGCSGSFCGADCPGTANHHGCVGVFGTCTMFTVVCSGIVQPTCTLTSSGCHCQSPNIPTGLNCPRAMC